MGLDNTKIKHIMDIDFENKLLMSQLISEIRKNPDHISITVTGTGLMELTKAIQQVLHEEIEAEKKKTSDSELGLMTRQEVQDKLNISPTTLWHWEKAKYLVPIKLGRRVYYKRQDIENLIYGK